MFDIIIEILRAAFTGFMLYYLFSRIRSEGLWKCEGWNYILYGFVALFLATLLDITDNIPGLEKYVVVGDTVPQAVLEKVFGYLFSSVLILTGFVKLIPATSELIRTQRELKEKESLYRFMVHEINSVILRWDLDGRIIYMNDFGLRLFGYTFEELRGRHVVGTIVPKLDSEGRDLSLLIADLIRHPENYDINENENLCKDGRRVYVQWTNRTIYDANGNRKEILSAGIDISERKRLEEELVQAQKREAVGNLAGGIAHDFNNILSGILGYAELAEMEVKGNEHLASYIQQIKKAGARARNLIRQILSFTRRTHEQRHPVRLAVVIEEAVNLLRASIPSTIELKLNIQSSSSVLADPDRLHQVVMNLATNAFHAMEGQFGVIEISLRDIKLDEGDPLLADTGLSPGSFVELQVSDTGKGMDSHVMSRIFDPYFTTKDTGKGTGLGLSVVMGIVEGYNGSVTCQSAPGEGSVFKVLLPVLPEPGHHVSKASVPAEFEHGSGEKVVFVDDEEVLRQLAGQFFSRSGYSVHCFENGSQAFEWLMQEDNRCDILVTDMTMPGMTGKELIEKVHEHMPELPAILCSGYMQKGREFSDSSGRVVFVNKPFEFPELMHEIKKLLHDSR